MDISEIRTVDDMWLWCKEHNDCEQCSKRKICEKMQKVWNE